jgi:hypothetical protein
VQATRGSAKLEVLSSGPKIISLNHPLLNNTITNTDFLPGAGINYFSGNIFSNGGIATIYPQLRFTVSPIGGAFRYYLPIRVNNIVTLNGKIVINEYFQFFDNAVLNGGVWQYPDVAFTRNWTGYMNRGANMLISNLYPIWDGGINTISWSMKADTFGAGINTPQTDIIMY